MNSLPFTFNAQNIFFHYDELDTNAINFTNGSSYLSIQTQIYVDTEDEETDEDMFIEISPNNQGDYFKIIKLSFEKQKIIIDINRNFFQNHSKEIVIHTDKLLDKKTVDFFINHLFLGSVVSYNDTHSKNLKIKQSKFKDMI